MFVRVKSTPNSPRKSVQLVESVRQGDKVKQKIVRHVGIAIAFMAFSCVRHLSYRVGLQYRKLSPAVIRNALLQVQHSVLRHKHSGARCAMPSQVSPEAKKIYQIMGLKVATTPYQLT